MLDVPGAQLYVKTLGSGPVLLLLPGGDGDADACDALAAHLKSDFTVVTYDRRGLSRSTWTGAPLDLAIHAADASAVLASVTDGPAVVFGSSIGAAIALELTVRHPGQVRLAVAHEPPISGVLPADARDELAHAQQEIEDVHRQEGTLAAMGRFLALTRLDFSDREPDVPLTPPGPERQRNLEFFLTHDAPAMRMYRPDKSALRTQRERIIPATGTTSTGPIPQCAHALAALLSTDVTVFPGGHNGFALRPRAFAEHLRLVATSHADT